MAKITGGQTWRRYRYTNGWKVAVLCLLIAVPIVFDIHFAQHDRREAARMERLKLFGDSIAGCCILVGTLAALAGREVFVDAAGFIRVRKTFASVETSDKTIDLTRIDHVLAKMQKVGQGSATVPTLFLSYSPGTYNDGVVLCTFSKARDLKEEAHLLGKLIGKPVSISPDV